MEKEKRDLKFSFHRGGSGSFTPRMSIPKVWADEMGVTKENPCVVAIFEGDKIIIKKAKNK
ncbi:TPA: AbrB/MazE/SpoVT family DNA-binding domain-containing protein [Clostridioides difficile]|nr:AbrB/MazE/SpoVT family DNA-binding domain-containing protein [Clostridioides difficile]